MEWKAHRACIWKVHIKKMKCRAKEQKKWKWMQEIEKCKIRSFSASRKEDEREMEMEIACGYQAVPFSLLPPERICFKICLTSSLFMRDNLCPSCKSRVHFIPKKKTATGGHQSKWQNIALNTFSSAWNASKNVRNWILTDYARQ